MNVASNAVLTLTTVKTSYEFRLKINANVDGNGGYFDENGNIIENTITGYRFGDTFILNEIALPTKEGYSLKLKRYYNYDSGNDLYSDYVVYNTNEEFVINVPSDDLTGEFYESDINKMWKEENNSDGGYYLIELDAVWTANDYEIH